MESCPLQYSSKTLANKLSSNERAMFASLGWEQSFVCTFNEIGLYSMAVEDAFLHKKEGPAVEALRRAIQAIKTASPLRHTEEFENLVRMDYNESETNHE